MKQIYAGLFLPPGQSYRATDVKDIEIRYQWTVRKLPVFKYKEFKSTERLSEQATVNLIRLSEIQQSLLAAPSDKESQQ